MGGGKNVQVGGEICIIMADSCWYVAETTQHDIAIIFQWKINEFKKKESLWFKSSRGYTYKENL